MSGERFVDPIRAARMHELAAAYIVDAIERRRLRVGARLPDVAALAAELELSRPTVREALGVLEDAGVVAVRKGGGGGVYLASDLIPTVALSTDSIEERDIVDVVTARRVLETAIVEHATLVATDDDLAEIERTVGLLEAHVGSREHVDRADAMFHRAVVRAAHSRTLERALAEVNRLLVPVRTYYPPGAPEDRRTLDVHARQLAAMRSRDPAAARAVVDEHLRILEETVAARRGRTWDELFGAAAGGTVPAARAR